MHLPDITLPLCVSSGVLCECKLYLCQTLSRCVCYKEHISVLSVMLSNWTVNVFCSVPFWSDIKKPSHDLKTHKVIRFDSLNLVF